KGRGYYMLPGYPLLYAAGSVHGEQWLASMRRSTAMAIRVLAWTALSANILLVILFFMPVSRINSRLWNIENVVNGDLREELGWEELTQTTAQIRDSLTHDPRTPGLKFRRSGRNQSFRQTLRSAAGHQRHQFLLGAWLRRTSAANPHRY